MEERIYYRKPQMTNLPRDVGEKIFRAILSSQAPDLQKMHEESQALETKMISERAKHRNK